MGLGPFIYDKGKPLLKEFIGRNTTKNTKDWGIRTVQLEPSNRKGRLSKLDSKCNLNLLLMAEILHQLIGSLSHYL